MHLNFSDYGGATKAYQNTNKATNTTNANKGNITKGQPTTVSMPQSGMSSTVSPPVKTDTVQISSAAQQLYQASTSSSSTSSSSTSSSSTSSSSTSSSSTSSSSTSSSSTSSSSTSSSSTSSSSTSSSSTSIVLPVTDRAEEPTLDETEDVDSDVLMKKGGKSKNKDKDKDWDSLKEIGFEIAFETLISLIPGVGTAKDLYDLYKTVENPKSTSVDIGFALANFIPGVSIKGLKKAFEGIAEVLPNDFGKKIIKNSDVIEAVLTKKIKKIDAKRLIDESEGRNNGHTLARHLNLSDKGLKDRAKNEGKTATAFHDRAIMEKAIKKAIEIDAENIARWINNADVDNNNTSKVIDLDFSRVKGLDNLGYGYTKTGEKQNELSKITIILLKTRDHDKYEFQLHTAYPRP